jgi:hypothetical protein
MEARHRFSPNLLFSIGVLLFGGLIASDDAAAKVYRWVDENGEVHYSESLPPDYQDKGFDVLNQEGIVTDENQKLTPEPAPEKPQEEQKQELPRDSSGLPRPQSPYSETEMQQRMDNFLLLRYESEQEILDAMDVEIKQLSYDRRLLEGSRASLDDAYRGQIRVAGDRQRAGLELEQGTNQEIGNLRKSLAKNAESLDGLQQREDDIRTEFAEQLERYRYLVETWSDDESGH